MPSANEYKKLWRPIVDDFLNSLSQAMPSVPLQERNDTMLRFLAKLGSNIQPTLGGVTPGPVPDPVPGPTPTPTPGGKIDLTKDWTWTGDRDANGGDSGTAKIFQPPLKAQRGLDINPDGSVTFTARVEGARTSSNTKYARSELRELTNGKHAAWKVSGGALLEAQLKVHEVPVKDDGTPGRIVIGQYHGPSDELARLYFDNGMIYFINDKSDPDAKERTFDLLDGSGQVSAIKLGDKFSYALLVKDNWLSATVRHGDKVYTRSERAGKFWTDSQLCYAKCGVYLGVAKPGSGAGSVGSGRGSATFYSLKMSH